jgi:hypothetical protein
MGRAPWHGLARSSGYAYRATHTFPIRSSARHDREANVPGHGSRKIRRFPSVLVGSRILASGATDQYHGERRVRALYRTCLYLLRAACRSCRYADIVIVFVGLSCVRGARNVRCPTTSRAQDIYHGMNHMPRALVTRPAEAEEHHTGAWSCALVVCGPARGLHFQRGSCCREGDGWIKP